MNLSNVVDTIRGLDLEGALGLQPVWPKVALELDGNDIVMVRFKQKRRGKPVLEGHRIAEMDEAVVPATMFDNGLASASLAEKLRALFEQEGIRPGRVSVVIPDNLAKISLLTIPEAPPSRKQLVEIIRFKMRRAAPFRLSDASMTYQVLPSKGKAVEVLVALVRKALVDRLEHILQAVGARPGLIDLSTTNLLNLVRPRIDAMNESDGDVALLNYAHNYFSLVIVRESRLVFYRCKGFSGRRAPDGETDGLLARELSGSLSYYQEKLAGEGIGAALVRSATGSFDEIGEQLTELGIDKIEIVDPANSMELAEGATLERGAGQRIAPAVGAVVGRGR